MTNPTISQLPVTELAPEDFSFSRSLFYPCSEIDGDPIKHFSRWFSDFFYADKGMSEGRIQHDLEYRYALARYEPVSVRRISDASLFGEAAGEPSASFLAVFRRTAPNHRGQPATLRILFTNREGIRALGAYRQRGTAPRGAAYIRVGLAFGGNYPTFRADYRRALKGLGSPEFLLVDNEGRESPDRLNPLGGYYFDYVNHYPKVIHETDELPNDHVKGRRLALLAKA